MSSSNSVQPFSKHDENLIQHTATRWLLAYKIASNMPSMILNLICAKNVDKWGRIPFMILSSVGALFAFSISAGTLYPDIKISYIALGMLLLGTGISSLFGMGSFITIACNSYVVDCTTNQERTRYMGYLMAFNVFGIFIGSVLIGISQMTLSLDIVLIIVAVVNILNLVLQTFVIKESIKPAAKDDTDSSSKHSICSSEDSILTLFRERTDSNRKHLIILIIVLMIYHLGRSGEVDVFLLYVKHRPLSWEHYLYGYYRAIYYGCMGLNLIITIPLLEKYCSLNDRTLVTIGLTMKAIRLLVTALCPNTYVIFSAAVFGSTAGFVASGCRSMLSKLVDSSETGRLFSMLSFSNTASNMLGPAIFCGLYDLTVDYYPAATLIIYVALNILCLALVLIVPAKSEYVQLE